MAPPTSAGRNSNDEITNREGNMPMKFSPRQISEAGRLLVLQRLQGEGMVVRPAPAGSSHHLETRSGVTIEVYVKREPRPAGGKGRLALNWMLDGRSRADLIAVTDISTLRVWLFRTTEAFSLAQQHPRSGNHHLIMVTDPGLSRSKHQRILDIHFAEFLLERRIQMLFHWQGAEHGAT
jgi:hypothetical protein